MRLDLSHRDIELILSLLYDTAGKAEDGPMHGGYTVDDLVLIDKLEAALKSVELLDEGTLGSAPVGTVLH